MPRQPAAFADSFSTSISSAGPSSLLSSSHSAVKSSCGPLAARCPLCFLHRVPSFLNPNIANAGVVVNRVGRRALVGFPLRLPRHAAATKGVVGRGRACDRGRWGICGHAKRTMDDRPFFHRAPFWCVVSTGRHPRKRNQERDEQRTREACSYAHLRMYTQPTQLSAAGAELRAHSKPVLRTSLMAPALRPALCIREAILDLT